MLHKKRGISAVITTILLILISIIAVILLAGFIIPMIRNSLNEGTSCFDLRDYVSVVDSQYTCYQTNQTNVMIERGMENHSISGLAASIVVEGNSKRFDIANMPKPGEARTYGFAIGNGSSVKIGFTATNGKFCEMNSFIIQPCF